MCSSLSILLTIYLNLFVILFSYLLYINRKRSRAVFDSLRKKDIVSRCFEKVISATCKFHDSDCTRVLVGEEERRRHGGRQAGGFREAKSNKSYKITLKYDDAARRRGGCRAIGDCCVSTIYLAPRSIRVSGYLSLNGQNKTSL